MPIILLSMILFSFNDAFGQDPIGKGLHPIIGDLYHTGGNIGIGTDRPFKLLHLYSDTVTTLRISSMCSKCDTTSWDFHSFQGNLDLCFEDAVKCVPVMKLTEYGQLYLGTGNPVSSSVLQIESTNKGLLIPRMTINQKNAVIGPANGLLVFDTDLQRFSYYDSGTASWMNIAKSADLSDYLLISDFNASIAGAITQSDTANWNTAYNFSQNFTETDPLFTAWDKDYNDLTNIPDFTGWDTDAGDDFDGQWSNLSGTPPPVSTFANDAGYLTDANINYLWQENQNGNIYRANGNVGIGTDNPGKSLEIYSIYNTAPGSLYKKSTIQLINKRTYYTESKGKGIGPGPNPTPDDRIFKWEIENANNTVNFKFKDYDPDNIGGNTEAETKFTFAGDGTFTATKFVGDGSGLTNIGLSGPIILNNQMEQWTNSGWSARLQSKLGTVWASTNKSNLGNYYLGLGMTNSGWYFMTRKDDKTKRYVCIITQDGFVRATRVKVEQRNWSDFVFNNNYNILPLNKLETYININKHLPDIPSAKVIKENGLDLGEMQKLQMQKIEELTLYIIQLKKENDNLKERILKLENE